jgi:LEA14-like dessication related protein
MERNLRNLLLLLMTAGLITITGCATLFQHMETPQVTLADLQLRNSTLFEQRYVIFLRVQNPNAFAIPVEGVQFNLDLDGEDFAQGLANQPVEIPPMGSAIIEVEAVSTTLALVQQLQRLGAGNGTDSMAYRVRGVLHLAGRPRLPFDYQGEINLAGLLDQQ